MTNTSALTLQPKRSQKLLGDAHLKFQLAQGFQAAMSMKQVQEVLSLPVQRLTPMPNMPACVLGLMNRRSHVMWVLDLARLLGVPQGETNIRQYNLIIVRDGSIALGLAVQQVEGIAWFPADDIQTPPSHLTANLLTYLRGCVFQEQKILLVLDAEAVARASILHNR